MDVEVEHRLMASQDYLTGARILIVEDSFLLASELARMIRDAGGEVLGPCPDVASAVNLLQNAGPSATCAVLDVLLGGEVCYPIAERLKAGGVAIVFVTGLGREFIDVAYQAHPVCAKPVDWFELAPLLRGNLPLPRVA
jgi:DNA-binding response OmpR family regulator